MSCLLSRNDTFLISINGFGLTVMIRDLASFQRYSHPLINTVRNPVGIFNKGVNTGSSYSPEALLGRIRDLNTQQMIAAGVVGAEVIGFFTVGEMLGRMKLVGYSGDREHHETATNTH